MKRTICFSLIMFALAISTSVVAGNMPQEDEKYPEITFEKTTHDFGLFDKAHGDKTCWFVFTNTGNKELLILSATASCGCTEPEYPKTAIMPGMKDSIKVSYKGSTRRVGKMRKTIALTTNCKVNSAYLYITGEMVDELVADRIKPEDQE